MNTTGDFDLPLAQAVDRFKREPGSTSNSYDWYRRGAQQSGAVNFGRPRELVQGATTRVPVQKVGMQWMASRSAFASAIVEHRAGLAEVDETTRAYDDHRLVVGPGGTARTTWGSYRVAADFHSTWSIRAAIQGPTSPAWVCSRCWQSAALEHNRPECHTCSDWNGCGRDCTLSAVLCPGCGTSMAI